MSPHVLRGYLGHVSWKRWLKVLEDAGVTLRPGKALPMRGMGNRRAGLTRAECERVMLVWYADLGAFRCRRWGAR